ncbi:MAG: hypothetical protein R3E01_02300 [Pirellulaceae bacterium]
MMSTKCVACEVEFIGGPIDGHVESLDYPATPYISATASEPGHIGEWLRQLLPWNKRVKTVAVYELHESEGQLQYRHAGSSTSVPGTLPCVRVDMVC